jgi:hypothetical protein
MYVGKSVGGENVSVVWCQRIRLLQVVGWRAVWWSVLSFLPPTLFMWVFSCLTITLVRIPSITEHLCPATLTTTHHSIQPLATTLLADTIRLRHFHCPTSSLYVLCFGATGFFLDSSTLRMRLIGCPKMHVRYYHYSPHINPEEQFSHLLHDRSLKSLNGFNFSYFNNYPSLAYVIYKVWSIKDRTVVIKALCWLIQLIQVCRLQSSFIC